MRACVRACVCVVVFLKFVKIRFKIHKIRKFRNATLAGPHAGRRWGWRCEWRPRGRPCQPSASRSTRCAAHPSGSASCHSPRYSTQHNRDIPTPRQLSHASGPGRKIDYQLRLGVKKVAHTRLPSVGFRSWSRFLAVSLQVTWVINRAVGCHYFPPGLQLPPHPLRGLLPILLLEAQWVWTVCLRLLPDSVAAAIWTRTFCAWVQHANHSATEPFGWGKSGNVAPLPGGR